MSTHALTPRAVPPVRTELRTIQTPIPVPESIPVLERLAAIEPRAMLGQPPIVWDRAENFSVYDRWGNRWIDWSSGVLITNAGHNAPRVNAAIRRQVEHGLLTNYCFPSEIRLELVEKLRSLLPEPLKKVFLLTTGSETTECAVKLMRSFGVKTGGRKKATIVSFENAFHGRTLASQQAGGIPALKEWIVNMDPGFVQVDFPDGFRCQDTSFQHFERQLAHQGVDPRDVAGVMIETYQGGDASFAPVEFMQALRAWCDHYGALLVCDEVQAGFGRTGTMWGFEHYSIVPDLTCFGKGISSSLPIAAVAGRPDVMDLHAPGSMTSTHTGNPVCCAAALASIETVVADGLAANAREVGGHMHELLRRLAGSVPAAAAVLGKGLVAGMVMTRPGTMTPDADLASRVVRGCIERGVLLFSPVGKGGGTVKICPPLTITKAAVEESVEVLAEAIQEAQRERQAAA